MDTSFADEKRLRRAETMLPPETMMLIECASEAYMDRFLASALKHAMDCGLNGKPLCREPYGVYEAGGGLLLRCGLCEGLDRSAGVKDAGEISALAQSCAKAAGFPVILGIGLGGTPEAAKRAALEALARPADVPNADPALAALEKRLRVGSAALHVGLEKGDGAGFCHAAVSCAYNRRA